jgi:hypothetical protein
MVATAAGWPQPLALDAFFLHKLEDRAGQLVLTSTSFLAESRHRRGSRDAKPDRAGRKKRVRTERPPKEEAAAKPKEEAEAKLKEEVEVARKPEAQLAEPEVGTPIKTGSRRGSEAHVAESSTPSPPRSRAGSTSKPVEAPPPSKPVEAPVEAPLDPPVEPLVEPRSIRRCLTLRLRPRSVLWKACSGLWSWWTGR